jgi:hypothetical protein
VEPVAVGGQDAEKERITAIVTDAASDDARAPSFWIQMHPILQAGL